MELHELMTLGKDCRGNDIAWELVNKYNFQGKTFLILTTTCPYLGIDGAMLNSVIEQHASAHPKKFSVNDELTLALNKWCATNNFNLSEQEKISEANIALKGKEGFKEYPTLVEIASDDCIAKLKSEPSLSALSKYKEENKNILIVLNEDNYYAYDYNTSSIVQRIFSDTSPSEKYYAYGTIALIEE